ncbi:MAG: hypothetical protein CMJ78_12860 [Planctomycetaceae bacterium]|nr:hypothetical protein [Planctomycetaceae bacterium]
MSAESSIQPSSIVHEFVSLCEEGTSTPDVFDFAQRQPQATPQQLAAIVMCDVRSRHMRGKPIRVEEYLTRISSLNEERDLRSQVIVYDLQLAIQHQRFSENSSIDSYLSRFPDVEEVASLVNQSRPAPSDEVARHFGSPSASSLDETVIKPRGDDDLEATVCADPGEYSQTWPQQELVLEFLRSSTNGGEVSLISIGECPLFRSLPKFICERIDEQLKAVHFQPGDHLMEQAGPGNSLMMISSGVVEISAEDEHGVHHFIARAGRGEVIGEMALLADEPRSANVVAVSPVEVKVLAAETFHRLAREFPSLSVVLTQLVAQRLGGLGRDVLAGKILGGYRIKRRLGRGGMAIVYEANAIDNDDRVALKMMNHRLVYDEKALKLFQTEADIIEAFNHPNIVGMQSRFEAFHTYFIVMQFCDGFSLEEILKKHGPISEDEFRKIIGQTASALAYAHERGVIHRDIKPANVMLNRDGSIRLMDFGLAKPVEDADRSKRTEAVVGTIRYMPPEQLDGAQPTREIDYFALGCTAYKLLTGKPLYAESTREGMRRRHEKDELPGLGELVPDLSPETAAPFENIFRHDPKQRKLDLLALAEWAAPLTPAWLSECDAEDDFDQDCTVAL